MRVHMILQTGSSGQDLAVHTKEEVNHEAGVRLPALCTRGRAGGRAEIGWAG